MKTILSLDDVVFREVKVFVESRDLGVGKALLERVRRGRHAPLQTRAVNCVHVVELLAGAPPVSKEDVRKLQDQ